MSAIILIINFPTRMKASWRDMTMSYIFSHNFVALNVFSFHYYFQQHTCFTLNILFLDAWSKWSCVPFLGRLYWIIAPPEPTGAVITYQWIDYDDELSLPITSKGSMGRWPELGRQNTMDSTKCEPPLPVIQGHHLIIKHEREDNSQRVRSWDRPRKKPGRDQDEREDQDR